MGINLSICRKIRVYFLSTVVALLSIIPAVNIIYASGVQNMAVALSNSAVSSTSTINVTWTSQSAYANGDSLTITYPAAASASATQFGQSSNLIAGDVTITTPSSNATFGSSTTGSLTINFTGAVTASTAFNITFGGTKITTPTTAGSFAVSFTSSQAGNGSPDFGSGVAYVGNANQVQVSATVSSSLSFYIRTSTDSAFGSYPATCSLGTLSTTTVNFCQYRLKVATSAANGFTVSYTADGALRRTSPSYSFTAGAGSTFTAGTEGYGANIFPGSVTGTSATVSSSVNCNTTSANCNQLTGATTQANFYSFQSGSSTSVYTSNKQNNPSSTDTTNTALVTHAATPSASTPSGPYTQLITYTVTGQF